jgi:ribosomal protein S7
MESLEDKKFRCDVCGVIYYHPNATHDNFHMITYKNEDGNIRSSCQIENCPSKIIKLYVFNTYKNEYKTDSSNAPVVLEHLKMHNYFNEDAPRTKINCGHCHSYYVEPPGIKGKTFHPKLHINPIFDNNYFEKINNEKIVKIREEIVEQKLHNDYINYFNSSIYNPIPTVTTKKHSRAESSTSESSSKRLKVSPEPSENILQLLAEIIDSAEKLHEYTEYEISAAELLAARFSKHK